MALPIQLALECENAHAGHVASCLDALEHFVAAAIGRAEAHRRGANAGVPHRHEHRRLPVDVDHRSLRDEQGLSFDAAARDRGFDGLSRTQMHLRVVDGDADLRAARNRIDDLTDVRYFARNLHAGARERTDVDVVAYPDGSKIALEHRELDSQVREVRDLVTGRSSVDGLAGRNVALDDMPGERRTENIHAEAASSAKRLRTLLGSL